MFSEAYGDIRSVREGDTPVTEHVIQCVWYDQLFRQHDLTTDSGHPIKILSPGWWNHAEGPDFKNAQIEINGKLKTGDIEVHFTHAQWVQHGHHEDARYDDVVLHVLLDDAPPPNAVRTASGKPVPSLLLQRYLEEDVTALADRLSPDPKHFEADTASGYCAAIAEAYGSDKLIRFLVLAGEWRLLQKARKMQDIVARYGPDQAAYEAFMAACGYSRYKEAFQRIARHLPYDRVQQLARQDPLLLEAALFQLAGLLPAAWNHRDDAPSHFTRLATLRQSHISGLRKLALDWPRTGVRPNNYPERRLAGAARFLARTAKPGLAAALEGIWTGNVKPVDRRRAFEALFPCPLGFWASHASWAGKTYDKPVAMLGVPRVRSIIGNVFIPLALAAARTARDRIREERVFAFFAAMPMEADNRIVKAMVPRLFGDITPPKLDFRLQQGMLQVYHDWCQPNPSCRSCPVIPYLDDGLTAINPAKESEASRQ